ncbi:MAG: type II toxin-antitoxin system RelE/ParE family toxin [Oscillospiraceae bacterium]|nr:type II toxin-antitoxin system RelE/ParE family toxin [Oscillospiraceae bacterium]
MSYQLVFTDKAKSDLRSIYEYIAFSLQSRINADRQIDRIEKEVSSLSEMPERYRVLELGFSPDREVRILTVDHYCIIYHVAKETGTVQVLRILYGGRDLEVELEKDL